MTKQTRGAQHVLGLGLGVAGADEDTRAFQTYPHDPVAGGAVGAQRRKVDDVRVLMPVWAQRMGCSYDRGKTRRGCDAKVM